MKIMFEIMKSEFYYLIRSLYLRLGLEKKFVIQREIFTFTYKDTVPLFPGKAKFAPEP